MYTYMVQTCNIYAVLFSGKTNEYITCEYRSFIFIIENSGPIGVVCRFFSETWGPFKIALISYQLHKCHSLKKELFMHCINIDLAMIFL